MRGALLYVSRLAISRPERTVLCEIPKKIRNRPIRASLRDALQMTNCVGQQRDDIHRHRTGGAIAYLKVPTPRFKPVRGQPVQRNIAYGDLSTLSGDMHYPTLRYVPSREACFLCS